MFKAKQRPKNQRKHEENVEKQEEQDGHVSGEETPAKEATPAISLEDMIALRNMRKARQGIDASKLATGGQKKRKNEEEEYESEKPRYGLHTPKEDDGEDDLEGAMAKARRAVRMSNFTQQTNALDVDKHMMAYIEENLKLMKQQAGTSIEEDASKAPPTTEEGMLKFGERYKTHGIELKEGSVGNSLAMLSAIPEVDLGMDARLRNIEETEKAKRIAAEEKRAREAQRMNPDEARLAATRFYNPHLRQESDQEAIKQAKYKALGIDVPEKSQRKHERPELASDEAVMERFRKRMKR